MEATLLITGNQSPLNRSIVSRFLKENYRVVVSIERESEEIIYPDAPAEQLITIEHDRRSPFSSRALFLDLNNRGIDIDHIIISQSILGRNEVLQSINSRQIEHSIDLELKGFIFFIKEALAHYERRPGGSINIVLQNNGPEIPGPMDSLVFGGIEALANSLFAYYSQESFDVRGFTTREFSHDEYAEHIFLAIEAKRASGKWYPYRSRGKLFSLGR